MNTWVEGKIVSRVWTKSMFQSVRRSVKQQGFDIVKTTDGNGYEWKGPDGRLLLKAMNGSNGYLVRFIEDLFV
jgi:hypothetical protein